MLITTHAKYVGASCIISEKAIVGVLTSAEGRDPTFLISGNGGGGVEEPAGPGVSLGRGVVVETRAVVEAEVVGEGTVVEVGGRVGKGARVGRVSVVFLFWFFFGGVIGKGGKSEWEGLVDVLMLILFCFGGGLVLQDLRHVHGPAGGGGSRFHGGVGGWAEEDGEEGAGRVQDERDGESSGGFEGGDARGEVTGSGELRGKEVEEG